MVMTIRPADDYPQDYSGKMCKVCSETLPLWAFSSIEENTCEVCRTVGRATNFAEFL